MKNNHKTIEDKLKSVKFRDLSVSEAEHAWLKISERLESPSPLLFWKLKTNSRKTMIPLLIGALMFASVGGTAVASNSAVPGDALFGIDRAVESVRLAFAANGKSELKIKFAEERLSEVKELIARARLQASATTSATSTATTTAPRTNGKVAVGVNVAINYLNNVAADLTASGDTEAAAQIDALVDRLETMVNDPDVRVALKQNGDFQLRLKGSVASSTATSSASSTGLIKIDTSGNKSRIEVREDGERIRIELKDNGELKIKSRMGDDQEDDRDEDENENEDENEDDDNRGRGKGNINASSTLRIELR